MLEKMNRAIYRLDKAQQAEQILSIVMNVKWRKYLRPKSKTKLAQRYALYT